jgi:hypothetical protein
MPVELFLVLILLVGPSGCGMQSGNGNGSEAPPPPSVNSGTLSDASYAGTQSPGDLWSWTASSKSLAGLDSTSSLDLGTLTATDQGNGYYRLSNSDFSAFALEQGNFLWVLPVSGPGNTSPPLSFNPIVAAGPTPCVVSGGTTIYNVVNFTNTAANNNQFLDPIHFNISGGFASVTSNTVNITGLTCSGGIWTGSDGLTIFNSNQLFLLVGDLGANASTGFPAGTTGFIAVVSPAPPISMSTLNGAVFVFADTTPTSANTANAGKPFLDAGVLGDGNVYVYGGCGAGSVSKKSPTAGKTPEAVGTYEWSKNPFGGIFIQYMVPSSCGFGGTFKMFMGPLDNGKLIGLPVYDPISGNTGAPILIQQ